jgi:hypothetical protein
VESQRLWWRPLRVKPVDTYEPDVEVGWGLEHWYDIYIKEYQHGKGRGQNEE